MTRTAEPALSSADQIAFAAARDICRRHARSFYFASFFLPEPKRNAAYAVYAFCRLLDDAIDVAEQDVPAGPSVVGVQCCSVGELEGRLTLFGQRLDGIYAGELRPPQAVASDPTLAALYAFQKTVHRYEIPKQYFLDLAEGCRMDLLVKRYPTWTRLEKYCYHVAGVVGLVMCAVFGLTHSGAREQAVQMGNAMQLTNILRDVKEDYERGRIYLPLEDLARFGYTEKDLAAGVVNENFRELMKFEVARARELYRSGADGLCWLAGDGSRLTASAMAVIYAGILGVVERRGYDVYGGRAHLTTAQKFARLPRAWRLARREHDGPLPDVF